MTPLHHAAYHADTDAVRLHILQGLPVDGRDESGFTPLLWSCLRGAVGEQSSIVELLIAAGADPNATTGNGDSTCLILAAQSGSEGVIKALLAGGAVVNATADGVTALMVAARQGDMAVALQLLSGGADPQQKCGNFSAADYARHGGHDTLADRLSAAQQDVWQTSEDDSRKQGLGTGK